MNTFVVKRIYGKNSDYLHDWCEEWGTSCMGSVDKALKFESLELAEIAAQHAQKVCMGIDGVATGFVFKAVEV
jgi:hypothetical protein